MKSILLQEIHMCKAMTCKWGIHKKITTLALMLKTAEMCAAEVKSHGPPTSGLWPVTSTEPFYGQEGWKESAK